jgi:hypothetical protein
VLKVRCVASTDLRMLASNSMALKGGEGRA